MRTCIECDRQRYCRGLCSYHYHKYRVAGTLDRHAGSRRYNIDYDRVRARYSSVTMDQWILMKDDTYFFGLLAALCEGSPEFQRFVIRRCGGVWQVAA